MKDYLKRLRVTPLTLGILSVSLCLIYGIIFIYFFMQIIFNYWVFLLPISAIASGLAGGILGIVHMRRAGSSHAVIGIVLSALGIILGIIFIYFGIDAIYNTIIEYVPPGLTLLP